MDENFDFFDDMIVDPPVPAEEPSPSPPVPEAKAKAQAKAKAKVVVTTKRFCACTLCEQEQETTDLVKGMCKPTVDQCSTDVACIEKGITSSSSSKKKYYALKSAKDKTPWRLFCQRWQHVVGPAMGRPG